MEDIYNMEAHCLNCGNVWTEKIQRGIPVAVHEKTITCEECGCGHISIEKPMRFR